MSSRAEEKERRRQERMAAEQAAASSAARRKRMGIVGGGVLVAAIVVVIVLAVVAGGEESGGNGPGADARIPGEQITNLAEAARAADCEVGTHRIEGRDHTGEAVEYQTNPPTSGDHDPTPAQDGIYAPGNPPDVEASVHSLEHGRVLIQYPKGTPQQRINQLETLFAEEVKGSAGYHTLLFENQTNMEGDLAVTAWGRTLTCPTWSDKVFDAVRAFRRDRVDKGPEFIP